MILASLKVFYCLLVGMVREVIVAAMVRKYQNNSEILVEHFYHLSVY